MAIESVSNPALLDSQIVGRKASQNANVTFESSAAIEPSKAPKPVPAAPKVDINREPLVSSQELEGKIAELNEALASRNQAVMFSTDPSTGKDVVRVSNKSTGELIRQMPSAEALKAMQNIDTMIGLIFNTQT
jgi:flagellar protein FlaG